jgi:hypothetical protein
LPAPQGRDALLGDYTRAGSKRRMGRWCKPTAFRFEVLLTPVLARERRRSCPHLKIASSSNSRTPGSEACAIIRVMGTCSKCGATKNSSSFGVRRTGKLTSWCRQCKRAHDREAYSGNREWYQRRNKTQRKALREYIDSLKRGPCLDCGQSFPPCVMDFDHVRGKKRHNVGSMLLSSRRLIDDEVAKCDLVCANCHRIRTQMRRHPMAKMVASEATHVGSSPAAAATSVPQ